MYSLRQEHKRQMDNSPSLFHLVDRNKVVNIFHILNVLGPLVIFPFYF